MQDLRDLECLIALARHQHFARAAEHCGLSQPAFSMRIRALEERLKTRIVKRGNRFQGFTPEGETVLKHAKSILGQVRALENDVQALPGETVGSLTIGVIPTAGAFAAKMARGLADKHPGIKTRLETATSLAIQQGVDDGRFDCGLTYSEGVATDILEILPLYDERYALFAPAGLVKKYVDKLSWEDAASLPLILLETDMQNRRIIDQVFRDTGRIPLVVAETNGFMAAILMAAEGLGATIVPEGLSEALGAIGQMQTLPLVEPTVEKSVCLVARRQEANVATVEALKEHLLQ